MTGPVYKCTIHGEVMAAKYFLKEISDSDYAQMRELFLNYSRNYNHENFHQAKEFWWQEILGTKIWVAASPYIAMDLDRWLHENEVYGI